jgi:hypothetical protein
LHEFLSPLPADRQDEDKRTHVDVLLSNHASAISAHLRRTLEAAEHERSIEEKAVAVMVAGLVGTWSHESLEALRESKLLTQLVAIASAKSASGDDDDQATGRSRARAGSVSHSKLSFDELRAAVRWSHTHTALRRRPDTVLTLGVSWGTGHRGDGRGALPRIPRGLRAGLADRRRVGCGPQVHVHSAVRSE